MISDASTTTSAVTRSWTHLDTSRWITLLTLSTALRTVILHPFQFVIARKRVDHKHSPTARQIVSPLLASGDYRTVFRGVGVAIFGNVLGEIAYLVTLEYSREKLWFGTAPANDFVGGMLGEAASVSLMPLSVVCNRQMTAGVGVAAGVRYDTAFGTGQEVVRLRGWSGLYAGLSASIMMLPASGVWWMTYGKMKAALYQVLGDASGERRETNTLFHLLTSHTDNLFVNGLASVCASTLTTALFNPIGLIRVRMQTSSLHLGVRGRMLLVGLDVLRQEGCRGLFKGLGVNCVMAVGDGLVFATTYELTKWGSDKTLK